MRQFITNNEMKPLYHGPSTVVSSGGGVIVTPTSPSSQVPEAELGGVIRFVFEFTIPALDSAGLTGQSFIFYWSQPLVPAGLLPAPLQILDFDLLYGLDYATGAAPTRTSLTPNLNITMAVTGGGGTFWNYNANPNPGGSSRLAGAFTRNVFMENDDPDLADFLLMSFFISGTGTIASGKYRGNMLAMLI